MTKITFYLDSGANIHSCRKETFTLDELGLDQEDWDSMSEDDRWALTEEILMPYVEMWYEVTE